MVVRPAEEPAGPEVRLVYADLDLAERGALRRSLRLAPDQALDDEGLVLAAYREWGPDAADRLGGAFAFAVWDGARRSVVAARDPVGLRPLFWSSRDGAVVIGGDVRSLLATGVVPDDLDDDMIAGGLLEALFRPVYFGRTFLRAVGELLGGHRLIVGADGAQTERYWRPEDAPRLALRDIGEVGEALREILREVVREAVADEPPGTVGVHLSSGIDSTAVAAFTSEALSEAPPAFSWQPPPTPRTARSVEYQRIEAFAERWGLPVTYCPQSAEEMFEAHLLDGAVDPTTMWAPETPVRKAAQAAGVRTLMSGWGGDEAISFSGRSLVTRHLVRTGQLGPVWAMIARDPVYALRRVRGYSRRTSIGRRLQPLDAFRESALRGETPCFATPGLLRRARIPAHEAPPWDPRVYMAWLLRRGHVASRTGAWARAGAPYGIRYRYPLLDRRVLAFALGLPLEVWLRRDGLRRWPLRAAGEGLVPDIVRLGSKAEPMWLASRQQSGEELVARIAPLVTHDAAGARAEAIDVPRVQAALGRLQRGRTPSEEDKAIVGAPSAAAFLGLGDAHGLLPPHVAAPTAPAGG